MTLPYRAHVLRGGLTIAGGGDVDAAAGGGSPAAAAAAAAAPPLDESLAAAVAESRNAALFHLRLPGEEEVEDQSIDPDTAAHGGQLPMMVRNLTATNDFVGVGVAVHGVKLAPAAAVFFDARLLFSNSSGVILLPAGATRPVVELRLKPAAALAAGRLLDSHLTLYTNVSSVRVSLKCFHGRLNTVSNVLQQMDLGGLKHLCLPFSSSPVLLDRRYWTTGRWGWAKSATSTSRSSTGIQSA